MIEGPTFIPVMNASRKVTVFSLASAVNNSRAYVGNQGFVLNALLYRLGPSSIGLTVEVTGTINRGCNEGINRTCTSVVLIRIVFLVACETFESSD